MKSNAPSAPRVRPLADLQRPLVVVLMILALAFVQRSVTLGLLAWGLGPEKLVGALMQFDSVSYKRIVEHGYHLAGEDGFVASNLAFFPLYPGVAKIFTVFGASAPAALLTLAFVGSVVAAWPIFAVGRHLHSARVGLVLMLLWGASPQSFVLVMGYPEGWFTAATAWSLLMMLQRRPMGAAFAVVAAGLLRPAAVSLVFVIVLWAVIQWRRDEDRSLRWLAAAVVAPLGVGGFVAYTAWRMKDLFAYFAVQEQWNLEMGGPWAFWEHFRQQMTSGSDLLISIDIYVPVIVGYVVLLIMLVGWWGRRDHAWIILYTLLSSLLILARETYFWSEPRQFLPLFPLLLPLANIRTSPWAWAAIVIGMTLATGAFGGAFLSALQYSP